MRKLMFTSVTIAGGLLDVDHFYTKGGGLGLF